MSWVKKEVLSGVLGCDGDQTKVLLDLLTDVSDVGNGCVCKDAAGEALFVDMHRLLLCLCVQLYLKMSSYKSLSDGSGDVWPDEQSTGMLNGRNNHQMEPSSPLKLHKKSFAGARESSPSSTRAACGGDSDYVKIAIGRLNNFLVKHLDLLLHILVDGAEIAGRDALHLHEVDRLGFLFEHVRHGEDLGSAEVNQYKFSMQFVQIMQGKGRSVQMMSDDMLEIGILEGLLKDALGISEESEMEVVDEACSMLGTSPPNKQVPMFNRLLGSSNDEESKGVICGAYKSTVLRGVDDCKHVESMRITDCHDSVIYCLAPLKWMQIINCSNSIVVLGAVGQSLRVEYCERLQVVSVTSHIVVNTCHDCILYTATNRSPLIVGDNRFVQLAPYNSGYQCLEEHMQKCGISSELNKWNKPMLLMPDKPIFKQHHHDLQEQHQLDHSMSVTILPPEKLMPFVIPFKGCSGPLCGGSAPPLTRSTNNDTLTGLLTQEFVDFSPCPFPLPEHYLSAWKLRMDGINTVREAYREAKLTDAQKQEFTGAVQSHFKEWLQSGGGMREVYDLAKVEKQMMLSANKTN